jgi:predicted peptidase
MGIVVFQRAAYDPVQKKSPMRKFLIISLLAISMSAVRADEPAPGKQVEQKLEVNGKTIPYLIYLPKDYKATKTPMMLFLHGRGESSGPLSIVAKWGPPRRVEHGEDMPYILVSPQCPEKENWAQSGQQELLLKLIEHIENEFKVDEDRVYLTGLSMGGFGSWRLAADHPELFAAVVPICGGGNPDDASKLKSLPIWVWHGTEDKAVPLKRSLDMVEAIKLAGSSEIRMTTVEHVGHNSWEAAYATPELYQWLNGHTRKK